VLETLGPCARDADAAARWRTHVEAMCAQLGWPAPRTVARAHASGHSLAFTAPEDQLFTATEINEYAWCAAISAQSARMPVFHAPGHPAIWDPAAALETLRSFAAEERRPDLIALLRAAAAHRVPVLLDDDILSFGLGRHGRSWPLAALPAPDSLDWTGFAPIPAALVTGSNGKTTTVRTLAAMLRAHGLRTAHSCTDGLFVGGGTVDASAAADGANADTLEALESGDYSGPAGARQLLRRADVEAAVLETARGGIMRRGLALARADVAVATNISADHFGEYGIHRLEDLAEVKLTVARAVRENGWLVTNADDALLREAAPRTGARCAWFSLENFDSIAATLPADAPLCAPRAGRLILRLPNAAGKGAQAPSHQDSSEHDFREHDLGEIAAMPLTLGGRAGYNLANAAGAALAAGLMGVAPATLRAVLARFGAAHSDNPGRLQYWRLGVSAPPASDISADGSGGDAPSAVEVFVDYAHNPDGMDGLLAIAAQGRRGRLGLLLGQAGNREDADIRALAATAARFRPDLVVLKDIDGYLRGRVPGEVADILRQELLRAGLAPESLPVRLREADAAREALGWARAGDVLVLPVHSLAARATVAALLDALVAQGWRPGEPLPPVTTPPATAPPSAATG
jgi:UDP-N-acetylmuramyl tripeptide synthase